MNDRLRELIEASAPLWAGEAEVVRTYFDSPSRTAETDRVWLKRQCFKEFYGSGYGEPEHGMLVEWGREIIALRPELDKADSTGTSCWNSSRPTTPSITITACSPTYTTLSAPPAIRRWRRSCARTGTKERRSTTYRRDIRKTHGELGQSAFDFTEGGYCTLYSRKGRSSPGAAASTTGSPRRASGSMTTRSTTC